MILLILYLLGHKIFIQLDTYYLIYYYSNNIVILLSSFKPRVWLYYSGPKLYYLDNKENKRISWQGSVMSSANERIEF